MDIANRGLTISSRAKSFVLSYKTRTKCHQEQPDLILSLNQLRAYEIGFIYVQNEVFQIGSYVQSEQPCRHQCDSIGKINDLKEILDPRKE